MLYEARHFENGGATYLDPHCFSAMNSSLTGRRLGGQVLPGVEIVLGKVGSSATRGGDALLVLWPLQSVQPHAILLKVPGAAAPNFLPSHPLL